MQKLTPMSEFLTHGDGQSSPAATLKLAILFHTPSTPAQDKISPRLNAMAVILQYTHSVLLIR